MLHQYTEELLDGEQAFLPDISNAELNQDIAKLMTENVYKILRINLKTRLHDDILVRFSKDKEKESYSEYIDDWLKGFAKDSFVYEEDLGDFNRQTDLEFLREYFRTHDERLVIRYRRRQNDDYHWVKMILTKSITYTEEEPTIMLCIRDIEREVSEGVIENHALVDCFNISITEPDEERCIDLILEILINHYDADMAEVYQIKKGDVRNILFTYGKKQKTNEGEAWDEHFGFVKNYGLQLSGIKQRSRSSLLYHAVGLLIYNIVTTRENKRHKKRINDQFRVIQSLSTTFFTVYRVDVKTRMANVVSAPDYVLNLLGRVDNVEAIFEKEEKHLVIERDRAILHAFNDLDKWVDRLRDKDTISIEFEGPNKGWSRANLIVSRRDKDGNVIELLYAVQEINDQKRREQDYTQALSEALEEAKNASNAKSIFLSNMSHDIRTPLNAIIGYTNLAAAHIDEKERVQKYLHNITVANNHLLSLINSVLDMSRIESGRMQISPLKTDLKELLGELRHILMSDITGKGLQYSLDVSELTDSFVYCDSLRLNQILINLLGNAIKFTNPGGKVTLAVKSVSNNVLGYSRDDNRTTVEFVVSDTGIGIGEDFLEKLFEPFEREQNTTISGIQGTGLGLSITKRLVDLMDGDISVHSIVGEGTTFTIQIPFKLVGNEASEEDTYTPDTSYEDDAKVETPVESEPATKSESAVSSESIDESESAVENEPADESESVDENEPTDETESAAGASTSDESKDEKEVQPAEETSVHKPSSLEAGMDAIEEARKKALNMMLGLDRVPEKQVATEEKATDAQTESSKFKEDDKGTGVSLSGTETTTQESSDRLSGATTSEPIADNAGDELNGLSVLLVEDNAVNVEIARAILDDIHIDHEEALNGQEAIDMLQDRGAGYYDVVLMDIQMPIMNGYEASRAIRAFDNKELANIPIIAMTANVYAEDRLAAIHAGMNAHVQKPIDIQVLKNTIKETVFGSKH